MTKWIYRLIALLTILLAFSAAAKAQSYERLSGWCESGNQTVTTDGRPSTTKVQRSYPSCTVTIYDAGTVTLSAIASAYVGTPKSNPFTSSTTGYWDFFALDGRYDVVLSGGGLTSPVTLSGLWIRSAGGGGGSGVTGSGTANRLPKFATSTSINDSILQQIGTSEIKFTATGKRINLDTGSQQVIEVANEAITGTTNDRLAILTGAPSTAIVAGTGNTTGLVGIVVAGGGITGSAQIAIAGTANCEFDGATGAGQYVVSSSTTGGKCSVTSTWPAAGRQPIGRVLTTNVASGTYGVLLFGQERRGFQTVGGSITNVLWNNAGAIAGDLGFTYDTTLGLVSLGVSSGVTGQLQFKNINNAFTTTIQPGTTGSNLTFTLPSSLPASTSECLQISSTGVISRTGAACGSGGGALTGGGTINRIPLWTGGTTLSDSILSQVGTSEIKFASTGKRLNLDTGSQVVIEVANDTSTGTTNDRLAKLSGAPSKAIVISTADTTGIVGVVTSGGGTSGSAQVVTEGTGNCEFDAATTAGQYVIASTTLAGRCSVSSTWPTSPVQVLGRVLSTNGGAGTYAVLWFGQERRGFQVVGGAVTNVLWNNSGAIAGDAGFTYDVALATVTIGQGGVSNGLLSLRNATNSNNTTLKAGVPSSSLTFTLPATLPGSAGCLQVSSTGVITQTGSACAGGGTTINPTDNLIPYRDSATTFADSPLTVTTSTLVNSSADLNPATDNTRDLGSSAQRWKTLHLGPGSVVVHNDATNTLKVTLGFSGGNARLFTDTATQLQLAIGTTVHATLDTFGNFALGNAALVTTATDGFLHMASMPGVPTGVPSAYTGRTPLTVDTTNSRLYGYIGGTWVNLTGAGGGTTINPTDTAIPYRLNSTTFADSSFARSSSTLTTLSAKLQLTGSGNAWIDTSVTEPLLLGSNLNVGLRVATDGQVTFGSLTDRSEQVYILGAGVQALYVQRTTSSGTAFTVANGSISLLDVDSTGGAGTVVIGSGSAGISGLKFTNINSGTATGTGASLGVDASGNVITVAGGGGGGTPGGSGTELQYRGGASTFSAVTGSSVTTNGYVTLAPTASTSGSPTLLTVTGPAHTTLAADTEATDINFNLSRTVQFTAGGGSFTFQRAARFQPPTYAFTSADTITAACTVCITGSPIAGTNATLSNRYSLWVESGMSNFDDIVNIGTGSSLASDDYLLFPFIGGTNSSGPAIRWASSASYASQSSIFLSNGFTFQGANSTHDPVKIRTGTGTSSDGTLVFEFRPGDGIFNFTPSSGVTSSRHELEVVDVTSTGTPAAGFGGQITYKGESSTTNTQQMGSLNWAWTDATHATRTSKVFFQTVLSAGSLTEVFSVQAAQNYGAAEFDNGNKTGAWTVDWNTGNNQKVTATGNFTTVTFSNIKAGARYTLRVVQDATGGRTWTPPTLFKMPGGVAGNVLTGTVGANDMFDCISSDGTNLFCNGLFDIKNP